jgi:diguanylate cyclase (GGDEF)-like protein
MSWNTALMRGPEVWQTSSTFWLGLRYAFGEPDYVTADFSSQDCWGLRRGMPHLDNGDQGMTCAHLHADPAAATYCVPLMAQGQTIGLLSLVSPNAEALDERRQKLALVISEQISLALANLALRDRLKDQSILDPLTGLFNRRYMEESFERERVRHRDRKRAFGVAMADIDHFKKFNDDFGHEAGDHVLKEIANALRRSLRPGDITCRFGGEEMVLLLPEADLEQTRQCAEHCRSAIEKLDLSHNGRSLGKVSISMGIAAFPDDGDSVDALIKKADLGLYQAKHAGRNQVKHHEGGLPAVVETPAA